MDETGALPVLTRQDLVDHFGEFSDVVVKPEELDKLNISMDQIAGLGTIKDLLLDKIVFAWEQPTACEPALSDKNGILFFGPPGTGATKSTRSPLGTASHSA